MTRILVVDDHPVVAEGWNRIVRCVSGSEVVFAATPLAALRESRKAMPQMLVADISFGEDRLAGVKFISRVRRHDRRLPILVFSMHRGPVIVRQALQAGANGFVNKDAAPEEIQTAFLSVLRGGRYLAADMAQRLAFLDMPDPDAPPLPSLSRRETEILALIAAGRSYREIAEQSFLSYKTVLNAGHALRSKLGASSLPDLVVKAAQHFERR